MTTTIADYENERRAFEALFERECHLRILLIRGESGKGKTTLLSYCRGQVPKSATYVHIDFKGTTTPFMEVLDRTGHELGWDHLPRLRAAMDRIQEAPIIQIDTNRQWGIGNRIDATVSIENKVDRDHRRVVLTNALFEDLQALGQPVVLILDTFEQADSEVKAWITGPVLARTVYYTAVRVVVAGQVVPEHFGATWENCCRAHGLAGVREAHHWLPVITAMGRYVDQPDPISAIGAICEYLKGDPDKIKQWIEGLPQRKDLP